MEALDRGAVAVQAKDGGILVSWRLLATDAPATEFDVYRDGKKLNAKSLTGGTNFVDKTGTPQSTYEIRTRLKGKDIETSRPVPVWADGYLSIPIEPPPPGVTPIGASYIYTAHEASAADLDGDGRYEIILKWDPADPSKGPVTWPNNAQDNAFDGYTGPVYIDAYTLDGKRLWRINLGHNIRAGAHYTQFQVFDYDGDGRAELALRTSDGTIDGTGKILGDPNADWRETGGERASTDRTGGKVQPDGSIVAPLQGRILKGPEFLTVFDGLTGKALASEPYWPGRDPRTDAPTAAQMKETWGDGYGNRSDRFLAGTAYLDGERPSIIMARGYYGRSTIAAWDWRDGKLIRRWDFDSSTLGNEAYAGQGNHHFSVADVDDDGKDEIVYGAMVVDDTGKGLWSTSVRQAPAVVENDDPTIYGTLGDNHASKGTLTPGLRHGDAMGVGDLDPLRPGLERWGAHEEVKHNVGIGAAMLDARTGKILWTTPADKDTGRAVTADIDPRFPGSEAWASNNDILYTAQGKAIEGVKRPRELSFVVWWDGDDLRELYDKNRITKWDWLAGKSVNLLEAKGALATTGTKNVPVLSGDLFGDWREEVIWHTPDEKFLRIYTTPYPTDRRLVTLMHDGQYRVAIAWQNTAYNQPPYPSFYLGEGMKTPPVPQIVTPRPPQRTAKEP
jgi:rhamnogalacturonan endolyase